MVFADRRIAATHWGLRIINANLSGGECTDWWLNDIKVLQQINAPTYPIVEGVQRSASEVVTESAQWMVSHHQINLQEGGKTLIRVIEM